MKIDLRDMGLQGENVRVDIWVDGAFAGDMMLLPEEWERLRTEHEEGSLEVEVTPA